jgi:hypothetical protein
VGELEFLLADLIVSCDWRLRGLAADERTNSDCGKPRGSPTFIPDHFRYDPPRITPGPDQRQNWALFPTFFPLKM